MSLVDLLISIGSAGLAVFSLPTVLNKNSQVPRKTASIPSASILTYFVPLFAVSGLVITAVTIAGQAVVWWLIVAFRPVRSKNHDGPAAGHQTTSANSSAKLETVNFSEVFEPARGVKEPTAVGSSIKEEKGSNQHSNARYHRSSKR